MPAVKVCVKCGRDVAHEKRVKDPQGRYYCAACYEGTKKAAAGATAGAVSGAATGAPGGGGEAGAEQDVLKGIEGELDLMPVAEEKKVAGRGRSLAGGRGAEVQMGGGPVCPCCQKEVPLGAKICVGCGIQVPSGRPVITSLGRDEDALYANTEGIIKVISYILRFGMYPIASEAYAIRKPIAIWVIAAVTTITSIWFYFAIRSEGQAETAVKLMMWPREGADQRLLSIYHRLDPDLQEALRAKADDPNAAWAGKAQWERIIAAMRAAVLGAAAGDFHWYQLLTNALLHDPGSILGLAMHLGGNMLFMLIFGTRVNALVGNLKMAILYPVLAVLASGAQLLFSRNEGGGGGGPVLGASGAIMGLAGMYLIFFPVHRVYMAVWLRIWWTTVWMKIWAMRGFWVLLFYIAFDVAGTLIFRSEDGVAHWAHLGGFICGAGIALIMLVARMQSARHGDLLSVVLGKGAWVLIGKPTPLIRGEVVG
jgi:membrane associated rhomboid family serine protease